MSSTKAEASDGPPPKKGGKKKLIIFAAIALLLGGAGGGAYFFAPGLFGKQPVSQEASKAELPAPKPVFVELPEMSLSLPNGSQARQLRIKIALELIAKGPEAPQPQVLSPKVYDALLTYLRTLTDSEVQGSLAIDRIRGDLFRRLELLLGPNVVRDVLITSLVTA
ncbi:MAG: flagellar basal body-associated FliL family protein [Alphaproteobacteria bacterium]|nr:flagellar basal body-associated FliL family protein [Alphaproteobacteria bacterium]